MGRTSCNGTEAEMDGLIDVTCTIYPLFDHIFKSALGVFLEGNKFKSKLYLYAWLPACVDFKDISSHPVCCQET